MRLYIIALFLCFSLLTPFISHPAHAVLRLTVEGDGTLTPLPIAVADFTGNNATGQQIADVIRSDLERSGLFRPINKNAFIQQVGSDFTVPRFADWRQINAEGLVHGTVEQTSAGMIRVTYRLWDTYGEQQISARAFNTESTHWRRVAHMISDDIYSRITGDSGFFDTRVVYVSETGPKNRRIKRLAIMDWDGENHKFLTNGNNMVLTPRYSPTTQEVLYLSYASGQPRVYLRDLNTGREESLGAFNGMTFAPRFNHDGSRIVMSFAKNGNTDILEMDLRSRRTRQLTNDGAIDTSPSYSPDGSQIAFNSDRGGSQQLYVMDASGGNVKRISFGQGRYSTPVWSPRQDLIAFTKQVGGTFHIGVMRPDGSGERLLANGWLVEGPAWSPNGAYIMYNKQVGGSAGTMLSYVHISGKFKRDILTPAGASDPTWSPLLK